MLYSWMVLLHVLCGALLAMTLVIMQWVVGPALATIHDEKVKEGAISLIQRRWHPIVDFSIFLMLCSAIYLAAVQWEMIGATPLLHIKVTLGFLALGCSASLHFYFRGLKRRLKKAGEKERVKSISKGTAILEKIALFCGVGAFLLGILFNHSPF